MATVTETAGQKTALWETRRSARAGVRCTVRLVMDESMSGRVTPVRGEVSAEMLDISTSGIGVDMDTYLPKGTRVRTQWPASLLAVDDEEGDDEPMQVCAKVVYARGGPDTFRGGLTFEELPEPYRRRIDRFVAASERRRLPRARLA
jgi:hypothetical protein